MTGKAGLSLLPGTIFFDGNKMEMAKAFDLFRNQRNLQRYLGIYLAPESFFFISGSEIMVGAGHVLLLQAILNDPADTSFKLFQFNPGEKADLSPFGIRQ